MTTPPPPRPDATTVQTAALVVVAAAAAWYLMNQLTSILRPFFLAVFLAYVLLPYHGRLRKRIGAYASVVVLAGVTAGVLAGVALSVYASLVGLTDELPQLQARGAALYAHVERLLAAYAPGWAKDLTPGDKPGERLAVEVSLGLRVAAAVAAEFLIEAGVVGLYLLFLLLEAARVPDRVRNAYPRDRADEILRVAGHVNAAVVGYLKAKVRASLVLAVPIGLVLWACGVRFAFLWAILTFLCNFIPYVGSVTAYALPVAFAFLQLDAGLTPVAVAALLLGWHAVTSSVVEPTIIGKAVGLSPLVILGSLAFWGLLWGLPGMFLAVPLTVVAVIVMNHFDLTRPVARFLGGE